MLCRSFFTPGRDIGSTLSTPLTMLTPSPFLTLPLLFLPPLLPFPFNFFPFPSPPFPSLSRLAFPSSPSSSLPCLPLTSPSFSLPSPIPFLPFLPLSFLSFLSSPCPSPSPPFLPHFLPLPLWRGWPIFRVPVIYLLVWELDLQRNKCNIRYYKINNICIEEVKLTNDFSKETII